MAQTSTPPGETKTDRALEDRMLEVAADQERVNVIASARQFKRSWIELAEALARVNERNLWQGWGFDTFEHYCKGELHISPATAAKLVSSFRFLRSNAPRVIERAKTQEPGPIPTMSAVNFVAKAQDQGFAGKDVMKELRRAAFEEGMEGPALTKKFSPVVFPTNTAQDAARIRGQILATSRRLAALIAEEGSPLPANLASKLEQALGEVVERLSQGEN